MATIGRFNPTKVRAKVLSNSWVAVALPEFAVLGPNSIAWSGVGGSSYTVTASPSLGTATVSGDTCTFASAMTVGTTYTFTVTPNSGAALVFKGYRFGYTGASQTFTAQAIVPEVASGTVSVRMTLLGAAGGAGFLDAVGTPGGRTIANLPISNSSSGTVYLYVGGMGGNYCRDTYTTLTCASFVGEGLGGWNGGSAGGSNGSAYYGVSAGGGGSTDIRIGGTALSNRVLVAGGGGGDYAQYLTSGRGGGALGEQGRSVGTTGGLGGGGGTQSAGGAGGARAGYSGGNGSGGSLGSGGAGGACGEAWCLGGGGGGGGYYGGGGGEAGDSSIQNSGAGGGGGSAFRDTATGSQSTWADSISGVGLGSTSNGSIIWAWA